MACVSCGVLVLLCTPSKHHTGCHLWKELCTCILIPMKRFIYSIIKCTAYRYKDMIRKSALTRSTVHLYSTLYHMNDIRAVAVRTPG